jgi:hypothetical protein
MPRMLGRNREAGCGLGCCRRCRKGDETRRFKRREERDAAADVRQALEARELGRKLREGKPVVFRSRRWLDA